MRLMARISSALTAMMLLLAAGQALALTPANTKLTNTATLTYDGNATGIEAGITVTVSLITANVVIGAPYSAPLDQSKPENAADFSAQYRVYSQNNGFDTYTVATAVANNINVTGSGAFVANGGVDLELGATALSVVSTVSTTIMVPSDGVADAEVNGLENGDKVVISGIEYTISAAVVDSGTGNVSITLNIPVPAALPLGTGVYEAKFFNVTTTDVGAVTTPPGAATLTIRTTIDNGIDSPAFFDDLDIEVVQINLDKYVRCISGCDDSAGTGPTLTYDSSTNTLATNIYYTGAVTAEPAGVLEYLLVVENPTSTAITTAILADDLADFTSYVPTTTFMNGVAVDDEGGFALDATTADNGGLELDDGTGFVGEGDGAIGGTSTVYVVYRVLVQ